MRRLYFLSIVILSTLTPFTLAQKGGGGGGGAAPAGGGGGAAPAGGGGAPPAGGGGAPQGGGGTAAPQGGNPGQNQSNGNGQNQSGSNGQNQAGSNGQNQSGTNPNGNNANNPNGNNNNNPNGNNPNGNNNGNNNNPNGNNANNPNGNNNANNPNGNNANNPNGNNANNPNGNNNNNPNGNNPNGNNANNPNGNNANNPNGNTNPFNTNTDRFGNSVPNNGTNSNGTNNNGNNLNGVNSNFPTYVLKSGSFPPALYQMNGISQSLKLTPAQTNQLNQLTQQLQNRFGPDYTKLDGLSAKELFTRNNDLNRQFQTDWQNGARNIMDATQFGRYQQLTYQHGRFNSLLDPAVQTQLNLTPTQMQNLQQAIDWSNGQLQTITQTGSTDQTKGMQLYGDYQKQYEQRMTNFLTPDQLKTWQKITGESFNFHPGFAGTNN